jgi:hypothetical protein
MQRIVENTKDYEQWENTTAARVVLRRLDRKGELTDELIGSFRKFQISPQERKLNQEQAADAESDPFQNGRLAPVRLIETEEDYEAIKSNPNIVGEEDMKGILAKTSVKAFKERIEQISNPYALQRMLEIASNDDKATNRQVEIIKARLVEISPSNFTEVVTQAGPQSGTGMRPVTPK